MNAFPPHLLRCAETIHEMKEGGFLFVGWLCSAGGSWGFLMTIKVGWPGASWQDPVARWVVPPSLLVLVGWRAVAVLRFVIMQ